VKFAVTGSDGFIGQNLTVSLRELGHEVLGVTLDTSPRSYAEIFSQADAVVHLAGVNRPQTEAEFETGNAGFTAEVCGLLQELNKRIPIVFASSTQAELDNAYGRSKRAAEIAIEEYGARNSILTRSLRLPNVFGKWSRPNYNSAVATFCNAIANGLPYKVHDASAPLSLVYVDGVVECFIASAVALVNGTSLPELQPVYKTTVGELASILEEFKASARTLNVGNVGVGLRRALYSTYISFLPRQDFVSKLTLHSDSRGDFVELLRTPEAGQFSYFTAHPGITRGGHYHHTKTEKFLVIAGKARFRFRHLLTNERFEIDVNGGEGRVVDTIPGWVHDVTNVGSDLLLVMLWANELFDRSKPDTVAAEM
jgi:UDP-2-acetamido-2,6-beta-L-arabino-hexul-4-ose reductase